jgi:hypothetical protein
MAAPSRSKSVAGSLEPGFPEGFQRVLDDGLLTAIENGRDAEWTTFAICFRYVHPFDWLGAPGTLGTEYVYQGASGRRCFDDDFVNPSRVSASIDLRDSPHAQERVGIAAQHEFLQRANFLQIARLGGPKDALTQIADVALGAPPVDGAPIGRSHRSICRGVSLHPTFPMICSLVIGLWVVWPIPVSRLSA